MPRVSIASLQEARPTVLVDGCARMPESLALFDRDKDPIHVHAHRMRRGDVLRIEPGMTDSTAFVWQGAVRAKEIPLASGSSLIVEHGARLAIEAVEEDTLLLTFAAARPPSDPRDGGKIHLLPRERVPRFGDLSAGDQLAGGLHADASCATCSVWLHENGFAAPAGVMPADPDAGIHSHTEDEVIFVTSGQIRLGAKLYGPGTALAIAADTLYSFTTGPQGLSFINFRASRPGKISFKNGQSMDEIGYWRAQLPPPEFITFADRPN